MSTNRTAAAKRRFVSLARLACACLLSLGSLGAAQAQQTLTPVVVVARAIPSGNIVCIGDACRNVVEQMQIDLQIENGTSAPPLEPDESPPLRRSEFCDELSDKEPDCPATAPRSPLINTSVSLYTSAYANGCGDGSLRTAFAGAAAGLLVPDYTARSTRR